MGDEILVIDDALAPDLIARLTEWAARAEADGVRPRPWTRRIVDALRGRAGGAGWRRNLAPTDEHNLADISSMLDTAGPARGAWAALSAHLANAIPIGCELVRGESFALAVREGPAEREVIVSLDARRAPGRVIVRPVGAVPPLNAGFPRRTLVFRTRAPRGEDFEALSGFLRDHGATKCDHYVGSLHDHLMRSYAMLADRGAPRDACLGAGLHSVYGTSLLDHRLLEHSERAVLRERLGEGPETLAYLFSVLDRPRALAEPLALGAGAARVELRDGQSLEISRRAFDDLRWMECANLADQDTLKDFPSLEAFWAAGE